MTNFSTARNIIIPEGVVARITDESGNVLWDKSRFVPSTFYYISLGDSIAAGHLINDSWESEYNGTNSQCGESGNLYTAIIPKCYTELINRSLTESGKVSEVFSFAHSGDTVRNLMEKLRQEHIKEAIRRADIVTICIGANDILGTVMNKLQSYLFGQTSLAEIESSVSSNLGNLKNDTYAYSYTKLFEELYSLNPSAEFIFTTVYNPYKELFLNTTEDGFLRGLLRAIPDTINIDIGKMIKDAVGIKPSSSLIFNPTNFLRTAINDASLVQDMYGRINVLRDFAEKYIDNNGGNDLNTILRGRIEAFNQSHGTDTFKVVETKALFDAYAAAHPGDYSDIVNSKYNSDSDIFAIDWGRLWPHSNAQNFWYGIVVGHMKFDYTPFFRWPPSTNVFDYVSFDAAGAVNEAITLIVNRIFMRDLDPHPTEKGHELLHSSFWGAITE